MNLEERRDRWCETLVELCRVGMPLPRVFHYVARKELPEFASPAAATAAAPATAKEVSYIGATLNHLDVLHDFVHNDSYRRALMLEDDVAFVDVASGWRDAVSAALREDAEYDVCFLAASKYHEIREVASAAASAASAWAPPPPPPPFVESKQVCTTSSAYLVRKPTARRVYDVVREGFEKLVATGDHERFCIDRYWCTQELRLLILRDKIAYQRPVWSSISGAANMNFD
jgi:hypothetical protein